MKGYTRNRLATTLFIGLLTFSVFFSFSPIVAETTIVRSANVNQQSIPAASPIHTELSSFRDYVDARDSAPRLVDWRDRFDSSDWKVDVSEPTEYEFESPAFSFGTPHDTIVITSNAGFGLYGFPGTGDPGTPYQIYDLEITANLTHPAISISNTDAFFVISNCVINGSYVDSKGIVLNSVQNALLYNNTCFEGGIGILLNNSDGLSVAENDIYSMGRAGIYLDQSNSNYVWDNFVVDSWDGIFLERSSLNEITDNFCGGNQWGIDLYWESDSNTIFNNTVVASTAQGIILTMECSQNTIDLNHLEDNDGEAIYLEDSDENDIIDNYCYQNFDEIVLNRANDNLVEGNFVYLSKGYVGILLEGANFTTVQDNTGVQIESIIVALGCISNTIVDNNCTLFLGGIILDTCSNCLVDSNLCNGMDGDYGIIVYESLGANTVFNNNCTDSSTGIYVESANNTIIEANDCSFGIENIYVSGSYFVDVLDNTCTFIPTDTSCISIHIFDSPYCTVSGTTSTDIEGEWGNEKVHILFENSPYGTITDNLCTYGIDAILFAGSNNMTVTDNTIRFSQGYGYGVWLSNNSLISRNIITNHTGWEGYGMPSEDCYYNEYSHNTFINITYGMHFESIYESTIADNVVSESATAGLWMFECDDLIIKRNTFQSTGMYGITTTGCDRDMFSHNNIENASTGIYLWGDNCTLEYNRVNDTATGMEFEDGIVGALVTNNTLEENIRGVVTHLSYVEVTWNVFIQNGQNAWVEFNLTQLVFDYNYWSDYTGPDANGDGVGDIPYETYYATNPEYDMHPLVYIPTPPTWIVEPNDEYLEYGTALNQQVSVSTPGQVAPVHLWWINTTGLFSISGTGLITSNAFLPLGDYGIEVRAYNIYGIYLSGTFTVTVDDTIAPTLSSPADFSFIEGSTGNTVSWTATDLGPASYDISLDGTWVKSGVWNASGEVITINCDGLEVGEHTYTIIITDIGGNSASDSVTVTVRFPVDPTTLLIISAGAGVVIVILIVIVMKKRSGAE